MPASTMPSDRRQDPIDLEHLRTITFDDRRLESEVLALFGERASASLIAIEQTDSDDERGQAAHRLVGAARAIGANELASAAAEIERTGSLTPEAVDALSDAMAAVIGFLEARLSDRIRQTEAG